MNFPACFNNEDVNELKVVVIEAVDGLVIRHVFSNMAVARCILNLEAYTGPCRGQVEGELAIRFESISTYNMLSH